MKRNKVQLYLFGLLAAGLLAGCAAGSVEDIVPEDSRPVTLSFGNPDLGVPTVVTRADGATPAATPLPAGATVRICAYFTGKLADTPVPAVFATDAPSFEATYVVGADGALTPCRVDDDGKQMPGDAGGLTVRGGIYDFYAVSPARKLTKAADSNYKITGIPHKEDVMTSTVRDVKISQKSHLVTLDAFKRKCALVVFNVAPSSDNIIKFKTLKATKLVVSRIASSGASLVAGSETNIPAAGGSDGAGATVTFESGDFEAVDPGSDPDGIGLNKTKGILLPKSNEAFQVEIQVQRDEETATLKATIDKNITFDEGKRYVFTLLVKDNISTLNMSVQPWNTIVFQDDQVGTTDTPYPDPDIIGGSTPVTLAEWRN